MHSIEWDSIRIFLAVVEEGSMSAAAQVLGMSQPTVSRQIVALEEKMGFNLFDRSSNGLSLTTAGEGLLESARAAELGVKGFLRQVNTCIDNHQGPVRLAAGEVAGFYFLPKALEAFGREYPGIEVEILVENRGVNLNKREADIWIAREKPSQPDMVVSLLHQAPIGFYAHRDYLRQHGVPDSLHDMHTGHYRLIGYDRLEVYSQAAARVGGTVNKSHFSYRTDSYKMQLELARAKAGITVMFASVAARYPELVPVLPSAPIPDAQWWLVCHHDVHVNPRIRCLMNFLTQWFQKAPLSLVG